MTLFSDWIGREEIRTEVFERTRSDALARALGREPAAGDAAPLLHHWLHFWDVRPPAEVGEDGHPVRGGFLPPVALPRRMWAGGRLRFHAPLRFDEPVQRRSVIRSITHKSGRSGELVFVAVAHVLGGPSGLAWEEEQDLVYRAASTAPASIPTQEEEAWTSDWRREQATDPVLLFRYSALTLNGHRIHYDVPYAREVEHYPGLVVQGPLQATLMLEEAAAVTGRRIGGFAFRGLSPAISGEPVAVCGRAVEGGAEVWIEQAGRRTMTGQVHWEDEA